MDYSIYDYNSDEKLLQEQEIEEINNVKMSLLNTLVTKLNNAGIYFNSTSRIKSESSLLHKLETQILPGIISGFALAVTLSLDDYFIATYTKPATFDTISTYVVNATKGSQTEVKTALWALSTVIFALVVIIVVAMNVAGRKKEVER